MLSWLPLLREPFAQRAGPQATWDLHTTNGLSVRIERRGQGMNNSRLRVRVDGVTYACKSSVADEWRRAWRE